MRKGKLIKLMDSKYCIGKGKVAGNNAENVKESIYFITGSAKITLEDKVWEISSPTQVEFPANTYHKIEALTDINFILFEN